MHKKTQRFEKAAAEYKEALEIRRRLAEGNPEAYEPDVATTLNNLAILHRDTQRLAEAEEECMEAVEIWHRLVEENASVYEAYMGETLCEWALVKKVQNDQDGMRTLAGKAVGFFKRCDERTSGMYADKVRWAEGVLNGNAEE